MLTVPEKKQRLTEATIGLVLKQGYAATSVDEICAAAGVTKGSFFHYFASKEEACLLGMETWCEFWHLIVDEAKLGEIPDPLTRVDRFFDVMQGAYLHEGVDPGCMVGTVAQELSLASEKMKKICEGHLDDWVRITSKLLQDAKTSHPPKTDFDSEELAWWLCSFVQGTLLIAKTRPDREIVITNIKHCRTYVMGLFGK